MGTVPYNSIRTQVAKTSWVIGFLTVPINYSFLDLG
jgi:hypothetical protein